MSNFQLLQLVHRGSKTQAQVVENLNQFIIRIRVKESIREHVKIQKELPACNLISVPM